LYSCHTTDRTEKPLEFPSSEYDIPDDEYAELLFSISSEIPETGRETFEQFTQRQLAPGTRGYIFNGDAASVRKLLTFATVQREGPDPRK
jgi:hypothetical protein